MSEKLLPAALCWRGARLVNPCDRDFAAHAIRAAFDMPLEERISPSAPMISRYFQASRQQGS
jgi:trehalose-6-phosphate synthase